ncbi:hypothetical protein [Blastochloris viridis]|uniref:Uncharacterized protein n=2 Tax=Blastochloris viridis TaxID=1079 RepID=A0A182D7C9_BLAVI|nr:hypothetical protein [Blastochloris viridis]BAS01048.1 hypothetical protein BV133_3454 [Blastochloris viridis]
MEVEMWVRCVAAMVFASAGLFTLLALTGDGPVFAVKERQMVVLGAIGELPVGVTMANTLAVVGSTSTVAR